LTAIVIRLKPARIETFLLEAPITNSVRNSFHTLTAQPALLLRITDNDGAFGWGEVDANPNPLREQLLPADLKVRDGRVQLSENTGLGYEPDPDVLQRFSVTR